MLRDTNYNIVMIYIFRWNTMFDFDHYCFDMSVFSYSYHQFCIVEYLIIRNAIEKSWTSMTYTPERIQNKYPSKYLFYGNTRNIGWKAFRWEYEKRLISYLKINIFNSMRNKILYSPIRFFDTKAFTALYFILSFLKYFVYIWLMVIKVCFRFHSLSYDQ